MNRKNNLDLLLKDYERNGYPENGHGNDDLLSSIEYTKSNIRKIFSSQRKVEATLKS